MIFCDTSFMVALIRADDKFHRRSVEAMKSIGEQLVTTWPCITEAMHLTKMQAGQESLRRMIETGFLHLPPPTFEIALRSCELMRQYEDAPMDFADASLVAVSEALGTSKILTYDHHFYAYRINGKTGFHVMP